MKAIWRGEDNELCLRNGKTYEILRTVWEDTMFEVIDETGDNYLYPAEDFEVIEEDDCSSDTDGREECKVSVAVQVILDRTKQEKIAELMESEWMDSLKEYFDILNVDLPDTGEIRLLVRTKEATPRTWELPCEPAIEDMTREQLQDYGSCLEHRIDIIEEEIEELEENEPQDKQSKEYEEFIERLYDLELKLDEAEEYLSDVEELIDGYDDEE